MIHFTTFFALVVGGMEVIQPAAAARVMASLSPRTDHGFLDALQRRHVPPSLPPECKISCQYAEKVINTTDMGTVGATSYF